MDTAAGDAVESRPGLGKRPVERHHGDVVRVVAGLTVVAITSVMALPDKLSPFERNTFHLFNQLPEAFRSFFATVQQAGAFPAVIVVTVGALVLRRPRLACTFALAGTSAWLLAKLLKGVVDRPRPALLVSDTILRGTAQGLGYPSGHGAVAAALATVMTPYLPRWGRRAVWCVVVLVGIARIYVGAHLPLDVVGGFALGWAVGAGANLIVGAPRREVDLSGLRRLFESHGLNVASMERVAAGSTGPAPYVVRTEGGISVFTKLVSNEERDADALLKGWRQVAYRGVEDEAPFLSPRRIVEHEAFMSLLAERGRVSTPKVVVAGPLSDGVSALGEELVEGRTVDRLQAADLTAETMRAFWEEVAKLHDARIAHRDLRLGNLLVDTRGQAWLLDMGFAAAEASDRELARDVAELLTAFATVGGVSTSVQAAVRALGAERVASALPLLEPLALSGETRRASDGHPGLLPDLRGEVAAATRAEQPALEPLPPVRTRGLVLLGVAGVAIYGLVPQLGPLDGAWHAMAHARWTWMVAAVIATALTYAAAAVQLQGAVPDRLSLRHTLECALASAFANRVTPTSVGGVAANIRYLQRCGFELSSAGSYVSLSVAVAFIVHVVGLVVSGLLVVSQSVSVNLPPLWLLLGGAASVLALGALVLRRPRLRRAFVPHGGTLASGLRRVAGQPAHLASLVVGATCTTGLSILAFAFCLHGVSVDVSLAEVALVYLLGVVVSGVVPVPGGLGVMEAFLTAGLTALGVPAATALAGVLLFRLVTWLPILPGALVFRDMRRRSLI